MSISGFNKARFAVAAGLLSMAAACGSAQTVVAPTPATDIRAVPQLDTIQNFVFPLDQYQVTRAQQAQLTNAMRAAMGSCMQRFGFPNRFTRKVPVGSDPFPRDRRYLFIDPAMTAKYGYAGMPESTVADKPDTAKKEATMSADEQSVLTGEGRRTIRNMSVPFEGCAGEARRAVAAGVAVDDSMLVQKLSNTSYDQSASSPAVAEVTKAWSACMQRAGYDYNTPQQAWQDPQWGPRRDGGALTQKEIATSTADMKCKLEVNYLGVRAQAEADVQRQLIRANLGALQAGQKNVKIKLQNLAKLAAE